LVQPEEFKLQMQFVAWFESPTPLGKEDINSAFARINAPAIAFPYLRSFISLLTLNSGFRPVILSTVNFVEMHKEFEAKTVKAIGKNTPKN
jgi:preprotein translocase subunit SecB